MLGFKAIENISGVAFILHNPAPSLAIIAVFFKYRSSTLANFYNGYSPDLFIVLGIGAATHQSTKEIFGGAGNLCNILYCFPAHSMTGLIHSSNGL
jgi:hypothetical protein